jgi:hypothetical protein
VDEIIRMAGLPSVSPVTLFLYSAPLLLLGLAFPYVALRMRDSRAAEPDPELGLKAALFYGFSLALLVGLVGVTVAAVHEAPKLGREEWAGGDDGGAPEPGGGPGAGATPARSAARDPFHPTLRNAAGLAAAGFGLALFHFLLIVGFTNSRRFPEVKRVFVGWRFAVSALVVLAAVTYLSVFLFQKGPAPRDPGFRAHRDALYTLYAVLAVWVPTWLVHLGLLNLYSQPRRVARTVPVAPAAGPAPVRR